MITVIDAVNEFKGEWPYDVNCIIFSKNGLGYSYWHHDSTKSLAKSNWQLVCNKEEFNQCVQECSNNFGKTKGGDMELTQQQIIDKNAIFDLIFHGCQSLTVPEATELLKKIKSGKIREVSITSEKSLIEPVLPLYTQSMVDAEIHESNNNGAFTVIERDGCERVTVQFIKTGYTTVTTNQNVKNGQVKDKLRPSVFGVGFIGVGHYTPRVNGKTSKAYQLWVSMLERCYSDLQGLNNPTYKGCTVCGDWHNFQIFAEWHNNNYIEGYHLDKDIKNKGNRMYSPFGCMFVSEQENIEQAHAKLYALLSPDGLSVSVYNMSKHCTEYGLCTGHMSSVVNGKRPSHKGWTLDTRTDSEKAFDKFLDDNYCSKASEFQSSQADRDFIEGLQLSWAEAIKFTGES